MKLTTTLNRIRAYSPCEPGWETLLRHLGLDFDRDADINLLTILESNDVDDMLWCLRATEQDSRRVAVQLSLAFAERVLPVWERVYPNDLRPRRALEAVRGWLDGVTPIDKVHDDYAAATAATRAARADADAGYAATHSTTYADAKAAVHAARATGYASCAAARAACATCATYTTCAIADDAASAACAARAAADAADDDAVERNAQVEIIRGILEW